jgi:hypothetical protein
MPRIPIEQTATTPGFGVTNVAQPISTLDLTSLTTAFMISNFSTNVNSVWLGFDPSVTVTTGIEITPGSAPLFTINQVRQLYETQNPLIRLWEKIACVAFPQPDLIPIVSWNPSHVYLITNVAGPVQVGTAFFKNVYV